MKTIRTTAPSLIGLIASAATSTLLLTSGAKADDARLIPKPLPHNSQGQEAGWSADLAGDFS